MPDEPDDCWFYECDVCGFLYTRSLDLINQQEIYGEDYWTKIDPEWYGRVAETQRLVMLANDVLRLRSDHLDVLDFGCGAGAFVHQARTRLQMNAWGTDINPPRLGAEWFLGTLTDQRFDVITCCEVIEHLPDPQSTFAFMRRHLKSPGVIAFQTAFWDGQVLDRNWWYLGPANGHISLYSPNSLNSLARSLSSTSQVRWQDYAGLQAWRFD